MTFQQVGPALGAPGPPGPAGLDALERTLEQFTPGSWTARHVPGLIARLRAAEDRIAKLDAIVQAARAHECGAAYQDTVWALIAALDDQDRAVSHADLDAVEARNTTALAGIGRLPATEATLDADASLRDMAALLVELRAAQLERDQLSRDASDASRKLGIARATVVRLDDEVRAARKAHERLVAFHDDYDPVNRYSVRPRLAAILAEWDRAVSGP